MASTSLYPPTLDNYAAAFIASGASGTCRIYYSLSKFSSSASDIKSIHISVIRQSSGKSVVNKTDNAAGGRYRGTGIIILNAAPGEVAGADNLYYVDILNEDIKDNNEDGSQGIGWGVRNIYKVQIRLSTVEYTGNIGQAAWLNSNVGNFSEWSTYCTTKAIYKPRITIPILKNYDSDIEENSPNADTTYNLSISTLEFSGSYSNLDESETLYSYRLSLINPETEAVIEDSGTLYSNQYYTPNQFYYIFKTELKNTVSYTLRLEYDTINKYHGTKIFNLTINQASTETTTISIVTVESMPELFEGKTTVYEEEEEGRIAIKLYSTDENPYDGNICIRRSSSKDDFGVWEDIKIIVCKQTLINDLDIFYDYTIESGVWYKYGVQTIDVRGERGILNQINSAVLRDFQFAYLLGEGGRQLKLKYDNTMNSYVRNYSESKTDTIGSKYPFITRNGNMQYRTIPVNGLISFNMDEQGLFATDKTIYNYNDVVDLYHTRRINEDIDVYDYAREHDFRESVLEFLQDGKPKLFKSATEGNIIVRLMNINCVPNQSLNRMIYSFTSTGHEIAEPMMENYKKYNFFEVGEYSTDFAIYTTKIGQLDLDFNVGDNIIQLIYDKYDSSSQSIAGYRLSLKSIHHMTIEFTDKPLKVYNNNNELVLGNNFMLNANKITVYASNPNRTYVVDPNISFSKNGNVTILGGVEDIYEDGKNLTTVHATVDFLYEIASEPYIAKQVETKTSNKGISQVFKTFKPGESIYSEIYYKYYYEWTYEFRRLSNITWTNIEAAPGTVFEIQDVNDIKMEQHVIGYTGVLNLEDLGDIKNIKYLGRKKPDGSIDSSRDADVMIDYMFYTIQGTYKED